jgi:hypothetical protein
MLVKSALEPQNPVCIVDRRLEFCAWVRLMSRRVSLYVRWNLSLEIVCPQPGYICRISYLRVNILRLWLIPISKRTVMNALMWATLFCCFLSVVVVRPDQLSMVSCPCILQFHRCAVKNKRKCHTGLLSEE